MGAYKHLNNCVVNLAQAKELSLKLRSSRSGDRGVSLKRKAFA